MGLLIRQINPLIFGQLIKLNPKTTEIPRQMLILTTYSRFKLEENHERNLTVRLSEKTLKKMH